MIGGSVSEELSESEPCEGWRPCEQVRRVSERPAGGLKEPGREGEREGEKPGGHKCLTAGEGAGAQLTRRSVEKMSPLPSLHVPQYMGSLPSLSRAATMRWFFWSYTTNAKAPCSFFSSSATSRVLAKGEHLAMVLPKLSYTVSAAW